MVQRLLGRRVVHAGPAVDLGSAMSEQSIETTGTGDNAKRIGPAPTTTDATDPERASRNRTAGSGSEPGEGRVQPAADEGVHPSGCVEPHDEGQV